MRRLHRALLLSAMALLLGAGALLALVLEPEPRVAAPARIEPDDVERALQLARAHDPRRALPGIVRTLRLTSHEAGLLIHHVAARFRRSHWQLAVKARTLELHGSIELPLPAPWRWLNIELVARETATLPELEAVRAGRIGVPVALVRWVVGAVASRYGIGDLQALAAVAVQRVQMSEARLQITYAWGADAPARVVAALVPAAEHARMRVYAEHLAAVTATTPPAPFVSLTQLLPPSFELARSRSAQGGDPVLENRAALLVLGMLANGIGLETLLPERAAELKARPIRLTLAGRRDFPQHYLVSAAIASEQGSPLADLIGLYKELADSRHGSGFSFNDIAANRAGARFGELAVHDPGKLQQRLAAGVSEEDIMPPVDDLPEFVPDRTFRSLFGGPGAPAYEAMVGDIEQRVMATPLFR